MIHILLADYNDNSRSALALLLKTRLDAKIVGEALTMETLLEQATRVSPDIILLDWELPGKPETDRIALLRSLAPRAQIVVISARPESASQALEADAFVNKTDPPEHILAVVEERNNK
jgi:two-component system response regulator DesR